ncbi:MAG: hypothetical protein HBSAPP02_17860 [Phycisphaerae bacterium]|nr:MAG: hypothetical protein HBSAPP02_17860 [Phycisphaerae bacterium]
MVHDGEFEQLFGAGKLLGVETEIHLHIFGGVISRRGGVFDRGIRRRSVQPVVVFIMIVAGVLVHMD